MTRSFYMTLRGRAAACRMTVRFYAGGGGVAIRFRRHTAQGQVRQLTDACPRGPRLAPIRVPTTRRLKAAFGPQGEGHAYGFHRIVRGHLDAAFPAAERTGIVES
jgi:hypothetical protein